MFQDHKGKELPEGSPETGRYAMGQEGANAYEKKLKELDAITVEIKATPFTLAEVMEADDCPLTGEDLAALDWLISEDVPEVAPAPSKKKSGR